MISEEIDIELWEDFLKICCIDKGLSQTEGKRFRERFCSPDEFKEIDSNLRGQHFKSIYKKFGTPEPGKGGGHKFDILFHQVKGMYEAKYHRRWSNNHRTPVEKLNDSLMYLNYHVEEAVFHAKIASTNEPALFCVGVNGADFSR